MKSFSEPTETVLLRSNIYSLTKKNPFLGKFVKIKNYIPNSLFIKVEELTKIKKLKY